MELSKFEHTILKALIKNDPEENILREQLKSSSVFKREYTGVGLYTNIEINNETSRLSKSNRYIEDVPKVHLVHPELEAGAGALLWFKDGFISTLECYTYEGDWPEDESKFLISG